MFTLWDAVKYRAADLTALIERKAAIADELENADSEIKTEDLIAQRDLCLDAIERRNLATAMRDAQTNQGKGKVLQTFGGASVTRTWKSTGEPVGEVEDDDASNSVEYRSAFQALVSRGQRMPEELRAAAAVKADKTMTTDVSAVIPTVLVNRIVERMEVIGMILPLVTKTNYPAGMNIPKGSLKPVASWVAEGASSDKQKFTIKDFFSFTHHKLRCEVAQTEETSVMALSAFESRFVESVAQAMVKAQELAIISGDGTTMPKGVLTETPDAGQALTVDKTKGFTYKTLIDAESALPEQYEGAAQWFMSKKTFLSFVGMVDSNGQPIARVDHGINGKPERSLLGRTVITTGTYLPSFAADMKETTPFAFLYDFSDYILNSSYNMGVSTRQDWDTEDWQTKAVLACDGKSIDNGSLVTLSAAAGA